MRDVGGDLHADAVSGARFLGQPDALLFAQGVLHAGFLLIVTSDRLVRRNDNRACVAVNINRLLTPRC
ncbi:Uncharacterised protein [Salmonella enterica subsp. enterica serovar Bovismorbificans]|uniref:Uncharacterized protein n=1 Tax=Salmonella enterica subsp. enterica serovar Bovismorbificans TaxID=58097 RepID=A0A655BXL2_SALET|nr:Uncharacterised protein [Salmonella enterica subsp. enterica serovar Bovismorbificans]CNT92563.1 Uncharacterised protein [Salmonella enterica subsp. enterica serovar Bovismorbificans]